MTDPTDPNQRTPRKYATRGFVHVEFDPADEEIPTVTRAPDAQLWSGTVPVTFVVPDVHGELLAVTEDVLDAGIAQAIADRQAAIVEDALRPRDTGGDA